VDYRLLIRCTLSPELDHLYLPHYISPTALLDMHHLTYGISSLLHSVNLILFSVLLVHFILYVYHLITVTTFALTIYHSLGLLLQT